jgi:hypothetical protein
MRSHRTRNAVQHQGGPARGNRQSAPAEICVASIQARSAVRVAALGRRSALSAANAQRHAADCDRDVRLRTLRADVALRGSALIVCILLAAFGVYGALRHSLDGGWQLAAAAVLSIGGIAALGKRTGT